LLLPSITLFCRNPFTYSALPYAPTAAALATGIF
jgi:hypothetical protein